MRSAVQDEQRVPLDRLTWVRFVRAVRNFASSEVRWKARAFFVLLIGFLFGINGLNVITSYVARAHIVFKAGADDARYFDATLDIAGDGTWQWKRLGNAHAAEVIR